MLTQFASALKINQRLGTNGGGVRRNTKKQKKNLLEVITV